jgi:hypothetical protein
MKRASAPPDPVLLSVGWGALWAVALGVWAVAPGILDSHQLRPAGPLQWTLVLSVLTLSFALIGSVLGFLGGFLVAIAEKVLAGAFEERAWAYAFTTAWVVIVGYALQGALIHWGSFRSLHGLAPYQSAAAWLGMGCLAGAAASVFAYRRLTRALHRPAVSVLARSAGLAALAGAVALVLASRDPLAAPQPVPLERAPGTHAEVPLLFIGLDGATWRVLEPAMASGSAPTLRRLVENGVHGTVHALWPPHWSGAAWAAIVTGLPREVTGVYEDLAAEAPGLPLFQVPIESTPLLNPVYAVRAAYRTAGLVRFTPPPRALLRGTPIWEMLHRSGVDTAVVRWRFTFPPGAQAGIVVSDWVGNDQWEGMGVRRPDGRTAVSPSSLADRLLAPFDPSGPSDPELLTRLLPGPRPAKPTDALGDPIEELELASDVDNRTFEVSEEILRLKPRLPFLAVYIGGLDSVEHAFWQYRFPADFPHNAPAPDDVERLGPVVDRYVRYIDERLARLLAAFDAEANVVIVSDHGQGPSTTSSKWRGWHAPEGVFIASGPSVHPRPDRIDVSYYDVVPTLAALKGFGQPAAARGRSALRASPAAAD